MAGATQRRGPAPSPRSQARKSPGATAGPATSPPPGWIRTCSIWRALEVVGDTSVLLVMQAAWLGVRRFDDFQARTGLLKTLLSDRLKRLVAAGVFEKRPYSERPLRYEYHLTDKGLDLYGTALMMLRWERRWARRPAPLAVRLHHATCGHAFEPVPACGCCGGEITPREVDWAEGPGVGWMPPFYSRRRQQRQAASQVADGVLVEVATLTGDRWAGLVLRSIFTGLRRFDEIQRDTAMATNILSERLSWLVETGVVRLHDIGGGRAEYRLTDKGIDYYPVLLTLLDWGDRYYRSPEGPPLVLTHRRCGHGLQPVVACSHCGESVHARDVRYEVVPAARRSRRADSGPPGSR